MPEAGGVQQTPPPRPTATSTQDPSARSPLAPPPSPKPSGTSSGTLPRAQVNVPHDNGSSSRSPNFMRMTATRLSAITETRAQRVEAHRAALVDQFKGKYDSSLIRVDQLRGAGIFNPANANAAATGPRMEAAAAVTRALAAPPSYTLQTEPSRSRIAATKAQAREAHRQTSSQLLLGKYDASRVYGARVLLASILRLMK
ncbi:hypothetical protein PLESTB_000131600 [Pleodorina starrii]|uniref:Uncharacterized protein n=1 Tax=Pleodorina starrii TaxID=330485 RepID=A0A9W6BAZ5_9CHLO|nr:hypothetical protein PLESTB_000131600 [Pleodorina starrii]GLC74290.1 hypothetical protein PLESTF_001485500 [Pleodorina starrii]